MKFSDKRGLKEDLTSTQKGNESWWDFNTMSYEWKSKIIHKKYSPEWYREIDKRFIYSGRFFGHENLPFDRVIPYEDLKGKKVLEIGCGMGFHTEMLCKAGAIVTSIDISQTSIDATKKRLDFKNLKADILKMDAQKILFEDNTFDFVWSWGVIMLSSKTTMIIKEIHRVLKKGSEARLMVYNLNGTGAYIALMTRYLFSFWRGKTIDQELNHLSDGYMARYYTKDIFEDIVLAFFEKVESRSLGFDPDAIPLPRYLRNILIRFVPLRKLSKTANKRGCWLFSKCVK